MGVEADILLKNFSGLLFFLILITGIPLGVAYLTDLGTDGTDGYTYVASADSSRGLISIDGNEDIRYFIHNPNYTVPNNHVCENIVTSCGFTGACVDCSGRTTTSLICDGDDLRGNIPVCDGVTCSSSDGLVQNCPYDCFSSSCTNGEIGAYCGNDNDCKNDICEESTGFDKCVECLDSGSSCDSGECCEVDDLQCNLFGECVDIVDTWGCIVSEDCGSESRCVIGGFCVDCMVEDTFPCLLNSDCCEGLQCNWYGACKDCVANVNTCLADGDCCSGNCVDDTGFYQCSVCTGGDGDCGITNDASECVSCAALSSGPVCALTSDTVKKYLYHCGNGACTPDLFRTAVESCTYDCYNGVCTSGAVGSHCGNDDDCVSDVCTGGVCISKLANGEWCNANSQCSSNRCSFDGVNQCVACGPSDTSCGVTSCVNCVGMTSGTKFCKSDDIYRRNFVCGSDDTCDQVLASTFVESCGADKHCSGGECVDDKVICTELHNTGLMSDEVYKMDLEYSEKYFSDEALRGYRSWGVPVVKLMRKNQEVKDITIIIVDSFIKEVGYRSKEFKVGDEMGSYYLNNAVPLFERIGVLIDEPGDGGLFDENIWIVREFKLIEKLFNQENLNNRIVKNYFTEEKVGKMFYNALEDKIEPDMEFTIAFVKELEMAVEEIEMLIGEGK